MIRKFWRRGGLLLLAFLLLAGCSKPVSEIELLSYVDDGTELAIEETVPSFTLTSLDGETVSIEDYRGKMVLLTFFSTT